MSELCVALLQLLPGETPEDNLRKGLEACGKAKEMGADIALFPEMWSCGYTFPDEKRGEEQIEAWKHLAVSADGDFVQEFGRAAAQLDMAVVITILEQY